MERSGCGLGWFIDFLFATRKDEAEGVEIRIQADQVRLIFLHATLETCVLSRQQATRTTMRGRSPYHGLQNPKQCWCRTKATMTNRRLRHMWSVWSTLCLLLPNFPTNFLQEEASPADEDEDSEAAITPVSRQSLASVSASLSQSYRKRPAATKMSSRLHVHSLVHPVSSAPKLSCRNKRPKRTRMRIRRLLLHTCADIVCPSCIFHIPTNFLQEQASQADEDEEEEAPITPVRRQSLNESFV